MLSDWFRHDWMRSNPTARLHHDRLPKGLSLLRLYDYALHHASAVQERVLTVTYSIGPESWTAFLSGY